jgi:predicted Zn-ribbon and HTH transcriptional regulator
MNEQCQACGAEFDEWEINELGLCQDCELERQGFFDDDDIEESPLQIRSISE